MALSDYAVMAFDQDGKPCPAQFNHPRLKENYIEIYKTRVHVGSPSMWRKDDSSYVKPFIAAVNHGEIEIAGIDLNVFSYRDNAIFVHASAYEIIKGVTENSDVYKKHNFCGIGCYGYSGHRWIGIGKGMFMDFTKWLYKLEKEYSIDKDYVDLIKMENAIFYSQGDMFIAQNSKEVKGGVGQKIGQPKTPFLMQDIRAMKKGKRK